ncbi:hypothetical protein Landi51_04608 [Colletotrichum acutatum]
MFVRAAPNWTLALAKRQTNPDSATLGQRPVPTLNPRTLSLSTAQKCRPKRGCFTPQTAIPLFQSIQHTGNLKKYPVLEGHVYSTYYFSHDLLDAGYRHKAPPTPYSVRGQQAPHPQDLPQLSPPPSPCERDATPPHPITAMARCRLSGEPNWNPTSTTSTPIGSCLAPLCLTPKGHSSISGKKEDGKDWRGRGKSSKKTLRKLDDATQRNAIAPDLNHYLTTMYLVRIMQYTKLTNVVRPVVPGST